MQRLCNENSKWKKRIPNAVPLICGDMREEGQRKQQAYTEERVYITN
jgi:hypothetical protein